MRLCHHAVELVVAAHYLMFYCQILALHGQRAGFKKNKNVPISTCYVCPLRGAAVPAGHLAVVNLLLEAGADALIRNAKGWAPAQSAAAGGHLDIVLRLVAAGACPRSKPELDVLRMLARKTSYK